MRRYDDLVAREPADDDEVGVRRGLATGRGSGARSGPFIRRWGRGLAWAVRRERILDLEVAMLEEQGLTLPPETAPLRGLDRNEQLSWRQQELAEGPAAAGQAGTAPLGAAGADPEAVAASSRGW